MDRAPLVHIGYHKTGTTWLQRFVFTDNELGFGTPFHRDELNQMIVLPHAFDFDPQPCRDRVGPAVEKYHAQGLVPVFSSERFGGQPDAGGHDSRDIADRLRRVFPNARVLIVIREQKSIILSNYKQNAKSQPGSLDSFLNPPPRLRVPFFDFDHFKYDRLVRHYYELFGEDRVLVLLYEMFKHDPYQYVSQIVRFASLSVPDTLQDRAYLHEKVYVSFSGFELALRRRINFVFGSPYYTYGLFPSRRLRKAAIRLARRLDSVVSPSLKRRFDERLKRVIDEQVGNRYQASNRRTSDLLQLNLADYGYDLLAGEMQSHVKTQEKVTP